MFPVRPVLLANITAQFAGSASMSIARSVDLGLPATVNARAAGSLIAEEITPWEPELECDPVNTDIVLGTVTPDGKLVKPVATSYSSYVWRLRMNNSDKNRFNTATLLDGFSVGGSGQPAGTLNHTSQPAGLGVRLVPGVLEWYRQGADWYLYRKIDLEIDLRGVRYSGTYRGNLTTTVSYQN